jgi:hypothetical protein
VRIALVLVLVLVLVGHLLKEGRQLAVDMQQVVVVVCMVCTLLG